MQQYKADIKKTLKFYKDLKTNKQST